MLALAEVKETLDAWPSDEDPWDDYDYYDEEDDEDYDDASRDRRSDHDDYQLNDLIDDEITLRWWTSPDCTGGEPISLYVPDSEVCTTTPSANLTPYQSEYERYMGNYGNTLDRWYRRAAVVVWVRDRRSEVFEPLDDVFAGVPAAFTFRAGSGRCAVLAYVPPRRDHHVDGEDCPPRGGAARNPVFRSAIARFG